MQPLPLKNFIPLIPSNSSSWTIMLFVNVAQRKGPRCSWKIYWWLLRKILIWADGAIMMSTPKFVPTLRRFLKMRCKMLFSYSKSWSKAKILQIFKLFRSKFLQLVCPKYMRYWKYILIKAMCYSVNAKCESKHFYCWFCAIFSPVLHIISSITIILVLLFSSIIHL